MLHVTGSIKDDVTVASLPPECVCGLNQTCIGVCVHVFVFQKKGDVKQRAALNDELFSTDFQAWQRSWELRVTACKYEYWHASDEKTLKQRVAVLSVLHKLSL